MSAVAGRRTYTEDELQAALRDIQSGKLGTRRAAVIYGIPRSTLRNKVYKLTMERERESHLSNAVPLKLDDDETMDEDKDLSGAEEEKEVEKALQGPLLTFEDILRFSALEPEGLRAILAKNRDHEVWPGLEAVPGLLRRAEVDASLLKRLAGEEVARSNGDGDKSQSDAETEDSSSNVILKIPSYKPTTSKNGNDGGFRGPHEVISPSSDTNSPPAQAMKSLSTKDVKETLAKNIKVRQSPEPLRLPTFMDIDFKRADFTPPLPTSALLKPQPEASVRPYQPQPQPQPQQQNKNQQQQQGGKGTRPKRGKYRNYDRDSLVEAVRAVQRGEMSVHRAGSYYGVPHSTLEYKVKERHLMRPRKRDPKPNPVDEKIATLKQNELRQQQEKAKLPQKPPQKYPPTSPNGVKLPFLDPNLTPMAYNHPFTFWHAGFPHIAPMDYARTPPFPTNQNFFASQMMKNLQESANPAETLPKSTRQMAESLLDVTGSNGFLDGIIRSSLESGVPVGEGKGKEEKNAAPENMSNKALLDQLCRNSRLTPLPRVNECEETAGKIGSSNGQSSGENASEKKEETEDRTSAPVGRIFLKQELTNPDNLKPEMLVRFRHEHRTNGLDSAGSVSEAESAKD